MWWHIMCHSHTKTVKLLLANYANPNLQDFEFGWTPLHKATLYDHPEIVKVLLAGGTDPNRRDFDGLTPFFDLAESDRIVRILSATNTVV